MHLQDIPSSGWMLISLLSLSPLFISDYLRHCAISRGTRDFFRDTDCGDLLVRLIAILTFLDPETETNDHLTAWYGFNLKSGWVTVSCYVQGNNYFNIKYICISNSHLAFYIYHVHFAFQLIYSSQLQILLVCVQFWNPDTSQYLTIWQTSSNSVRNSKYRQILSSIWIWNFKTN